MTVDLDDRDVPLTRFASHAIRILWPEGSLSMPDWSFESISNTRHIPGSNRNVTQLLGKGPQTITYRLWLDSRADLESLKGSVQNTGTLVLFAAMTSATEATVDIHGELYVEIPDVTLMSLGVPELFPDGTVEVDAVFQRAYQ